MYMDVITNKKLWSQEKEILIETCTYSIAQHLVKWSRLVYLIRGHCPLTSSVIYMYLAGTLSSNRTQTDKIIHHCPYYHSHSQNVMVTDRHWHSRNTNCSKHSQNITLKPCKLNTLCDQLSFPRPKAGTTFVCTGTVHVAQGDRFMKEKYRRASTQCNSGKH